MALWIGHYEGNPVEWFLVQAPTRMEAIVLVDGIYGQPDEDSLRRFEPEAGDDFVLNFRIKSSTEADPEADNPIELQETNLPLFDLEDHIRERMDKSSWHNVRREWRNAFGKGDPAQD